MSTEKVMEEKTAKKEVKKNKTEMKISIFLQMLQMKNLNTPWGV